MFLNDLLAFTGGFMSCWNDSLLIGVTVIDDQHRELVGRLDQLLDACNRGVGEQEVGETLKFVVVYIKEHFKDEEELQALHKYPRINEHKKLHAKFVQTAINLLQELKKKNQNMDLADKVRKMLVGWLLTHIRTEDAKVGKHINNAKANGNVTGINVVTQEDIDETPVVVLR